METSMFDGIVLALAVIAVGIAVRKWHAFRDRRMILSALRNAMKDRKGLWSGIAAGLLYLAVYMIWGGMGGRIHYLFGRWIWNTTLREVLAGIFLALLVMLSMSLFVYSVQVMGARQSGKKSGIGFFGSMLALLAAFCP
jgi:hypothetical protein